MTEEEMQFLIDFCIGENGDCHYIPTEEDIQETKRILKTIENIDSELMTKQELFCEIASHLYDDIISNRSYIVECWNKYLVGIGFLSKENKQKEEILKTYNKIIVPNYDEEYSLTDEEVESLLQKNGFQIEDYTQIKTIKEQLEKLWKDKKKMIVPSTLEKDSKEWQGIPFKKFLFCEEYIKTGRIKNTCENLGIGRTTAFEYMKDTEVKSYLQERQKEIKEESKQLFEQGLNEAFEELLKIIKDDSSRDEDLNRKVKAIDTYLRHYESITRPKD